MFGLSCRTFQNLGNLPNVGVGDARALCQGGDLVGLFVLDESEHAGCGLVQIFVGSDIGKRDVVRKPIQRWGISESKGA